MKPLRLVVALALVTAALAATASSASAASQPLVTGVTNLNPDAPLAFDRVRQAGARFVRVSLIWSATAVGGTPLEPSNPLDPSYDWSVTDAAVRNASAAGLTPLVLVEGVPSWAQRCEAPAVVPNAACDPDPAALREFAKAAAAHYSGRVKGVPEVTYFQALNEPNLSLYFFPQLETNGNIISPGLYRDLINAFYEGVKTVRPQALVVAAGLGPVFVPKLTVGPLTFTRMLLCMQGIQRPRPTKGNCGGPVHFDIFAIQPYTTGGPNHQGGPNDVTIGDLPKLKALLEAADRAGRIDGLYQRTPLWVTEFSWDSKPPDPNGVPMKILVSWVSEALHNAWQAGVDHFFWFSLRDEATEGRPTSQTLESGLYFRGPSLEADQPKPILAAFRFPFVAHPGARLEVWGRTPSSRGGKVRIQVREEGWRTIATVRAAKTGIFEASIATSYGRNKKGSVRAVFGGQGSPAFGMKPVPEFEHLPFG